jgi:uncharacterized protein YggL (DUF469 family)
MGNACCCDDDISKLDGSMDSLINKNKTKQMTMGDCDVCRKKNAVCFQNYGSIGERKIRICICCDIDLNRGVL